MLVEPLLPLAWRKQLDKQRFLKGDEDTDLFSTGIAEQENYDCSCACSIQAAEPESNQES